MRSECLWCYFLYVVWTTLNCRCDSVASAHGLWISFIQGRTFHDIQAGEKYIIAKRENSTKDFRREGEKHGHTRFPCLHYYHRECSIVPALQFAPCCVIALLRFSHSLEVRAVRCATRLSLLQMAMVCFNNHYCVDIIPDQQVRAWPRINSAVLRALPALATSSLTIMT